MTATPTEYVSIATAPALELIEGSRRALTRAALAQSAHERYASAHLAALRAAAAVIAAVAPQGPRGGVRGGGVGRAGPARRRAGWAVSSAEGPRLRAEAEEGSRVSATG